jgi:hypothetical protein
VHLKAHAIDGFDNLFCGTEAAAPAHGEMDLEALHVK